MDNFNRTSEHKDDTEEPIRKIFRSWLYIGALIGSIIFYLTWGLITPEKETFFPQLTFSLGTACLGTFITLIILKKANDRLQYYHDQKIIRHITKLHKNIIHDLNNIDDYIKQRCYTKEIEKIFYSYPKIKWQSLLQNAQCVDLCVFYLNQEWLTTQMDIFKNFYANGGSINIYLPNPIALNSRYFGKSDISNSIVDKIIKTYFELQKIQSSTYNAKGQLSIKMLAEGCHYMLAKITYKDSSKKYLVSPYLNKSQGGKTLTFLLNETNAPTDLKEILNNEIEALTSEDFIDFERQKYIVWNAERNTVYISTGLSCGGSCKFCYAKRLCKTQFNFTPLKIAQSICAYIKSHPRFNTSNTPTTLMLGGFNDPLELKHWQATCHIIKSFEPNNNPIHIATRFDLDAKHLKAIINNKNVVFNISLSSITNNQIERNNQQKRIATAKELIKKGFHVSLFIRPVILGITKRDLDNIIETIKDLRIRAVTVGGLYIDDTILQSLKKEGIDLSELSIKEKKFVLDDQKQLRQLDLEEEILDIMNKLETVMVTTDHGDEPLQVFRHAAERVEYYKNLQENED